MLAADFGYRSELGCKRHDSFGYQGSCSCCVRWLWELPRLWTRVAECHIFVAIKFNLTATNLEREIDRCLFRAENFVRRDLDTATTLARSSLARINVTISHC